MDRLVPVSVALGMAWCSACMLDYTREHLHSVRSEVGEATRSCDSGRLCGSRTFVQTPEYGVHVDDSSVLVEVITEVDDHGLGWQSFRLQGWSLPLLRRLTVGGLVDSAPGPLRLEFLHVGIPDEEIRVVLTRGSVLCAAYALEPPSVLVDEGYHRTFEGAGTNLTVEFVEFTGEIVNDEPDMGDNCVKYRPARLRFTIGENSYVVGDGEYLVTGDWVITVSAALRHVEGCVPSVFRPNVEYAVFRQKW